MSAATIWHGCLQPACLLSSSTASVSDPSGRRAARARIAALPTPRTRQGRRHALWQAQGGGLLHLEFVPVGVGGGQLGEEHRRLQKQKSTTKANDRDSAFSLVTRRGALTHRWGGASYETNPTCVSLPLIFTMMKTCVAERAGAPARLREVRPTDRAPGMGIYEAVGGGGRGVDFTYSVHDGVHEEGLAVPAADVWVAHRQHRHIVQPRGGAAVPPTVLVRRDPLQRPGHHGLRHPIDLNLTSVVLVVADVRCVPCRTFALAQANTRSATRVLTSFVVVQRHGMFWLGEQGAQESPRVEVGTSQSHRPNERTKQTADDAHPGRDSPWTDPGPGRWRCPQSHDPCWRARRFPSA